jgi:starch synthase
LSGLKVTMASSEISPFAKTGGLGDILCSLPRALHRLGLEVSLVMPGYRSVRDKGFDLEDTGVRLNIPVGERREKGSLLKIRTGSGIPVYLVRADQYFARKYLYGTPEGDYPDNAERFVFFTRAVLEVMRRDPPEVLHVHDWQSALAVAFLKTQPELYPELAHVKTVFTVHNLGYQGIFPAEVWGLLNLSRDYFNMHQLEFYGKVNFLKGGAVFSDAVTTVSPTYAAEIQSPEQGFGLDGLFRGRAASLLGILNGVDYDDWNPETDPHIAASYSHADLAGKRVCKAALQKAFGLPEAPDVPLVAMVTRLSAQKGLDLVAEGLPDMLSQGLQFVLLGTGEKYYQELFTRLHRRYPKKMGVHIDFDEPLAQRIIAGADILLQPSRYEPCGLTQLYALRYGTVPVVRAVGGLRDTIQECSADGSQGNGFIFSAYRVADLLAAVGRALALYRQPDRWLTLMRRGMAQDFSWGPSAQRYIELYKRLMAPA